VLFFTVADDDLRVAVVPLCETEDLDVLLFCTVAADDLRALLFWLATDDLLFTDGELLLWLPAADAGRAALLRASRVLA
jgi:hypothetical protein